MVAFGLYVLVRFLARGRPGLAIGVPIAAALGLRVIAAAGVSLTSIASELRGGDENRFVGEAGAIADSGVGSPDWTTALVETLHEFVIAVQLWAFDSPDFVLRIAEIGIAVAGLVLLATAVYELAGPRAALIAAWVLALEPSGIFFSSLLHKESSMLLAEGLVAFGGARLWKRGDFGSVPIIVAGCLVGVATRPYAGWFLIAAGVAIALHAGMRSARRNEGTSVALIAIVAVFVAISTPTVLEASSDESLEKIQGSQDANAEDDDASLALERVDFSTREAIITNLPIRIFDVTFKPFVWQLDNPSQRLGAIGGLITLTLLWLLALALVRRRGEILARAGPLIYLALFLLVAYSLSTGNAGTGFRYRTHLVAVAVCIVVALWQWRTERAARPLPTAAAESAPAERPVPTPA
jgi:Dolichyl-phosphate-mannose-protein mannosyltransferase